MKCHLTDRGESGGWGAGAFLSIVMVWALSSGRAAVCADTGGAGPDAPPSSHDDPFGHPELAPKFRLLGLTLSIAAAILFGLGAAAAPGEESYAVIASPDVPVANLSLDELRRLFLFRERFWRPGETVKVILSEGQLEPGSFLLGQVYRMDFAALRRLILEKLSQGEIDLAPKVVTSDAVTVEYVAAGRGLLALVRAEAAHGARVKVLSIDGALPGQARYALRR